jgi:hypothetical protein
MQRFYFLRQSRVAKAIGFALLPAIGAGSQSGVVFAADGPVVAAQVERRTARGTLNSLDAGQC